MALKYTFELIGEQSNNIEMLNEAIFDIKETMFHNLYDAQKALVDLERFDFTFDASDENNKFDDGSDEIRKRIWSITSNECRFMIDKSIIKGTTRENYRRSKLYKKPLTIDTIKNNNTLFSHNVIVFIQGIEYTAFKIIPYESATEIIFPFRDFDSYKAMTRSEFIKNVLTDGHKLTILFKKNDNSEQPAITSNEKFFNIRKSDNELFDMPIPVENCLVFKKDKESGQTKFVHEHNILKLYYPEVYEITSFDDGDEYTIYPLYSDDTESLGSWYTDELSIYRKYVAHDLTTRYNDGSITSYIKTYKPVSMEYNIPHFNTSDYTVPLHYKYDKFKEMIYKDGDVYKFYLDRLVGYVPQYEIRCSDLFFSEDEIVRRRKLNNHDEIKDTTKHVSFENPHYLFVIRGSETEHVVIWIDGILYEPNYSYTDGEFTYLYISDKNIDINSSIITVEKFSDFDFIKQISIDRAFNFSSYVEISVPNKKITPNNLYCTVITDGIETYADKSIYSLYYLEDGEYHEITDSVFYQYDTIYLKFNDTSLLNKIFNINISNSPFIVYGGDENTIYVNRKINNDKSNFMLFKNGRHIPNVAMQINFSNKVTGPHEIKIMLMENDPNDKFSLYYIPTKYYQVYFQANIQPSGFIDLTGKINKPFDFKWHDVYVNGRRLTEDDIEIIGPYMLKFKNIHSLKNFALYQKNLDPYVSFTDTGLYEDYTYNLVYNTELFDIINGGHIEDIEEDILEDLIIDFIGFFEKYLHSIGLINPDISQVTSEMINEFPMVFDHDNNLFINPEGTKGLEHDAFFEPDKNTLTIFEDKE